MAYYKTCLLCGANLDPGEPCDCNKKARPAVQSTGQPTELTFQASTPEGHPHCTTGKPSIQEEDLSMKPTPVLREYFDSLPSGKAHEDFYNAQPEDFQRFMNLLANAPKEDLEQLVELLEQGRAAV